MIPANNRTRSRSRSRASAPAIKTYRRILPLDDEDDDDDGEEVATTVNRSRPRHRARKSQPPERVSLFPVSSSTIPKDINPSGEVQNARSRSRSRTRAVGSVEGTKREVPGVTATFTPTNSNVGYVPASGMPPRGVPPSPVPSFLCVPRRLPVQGNGAPSYQLPLFSYLSSPKAASSESQISSNARKRTGGSIPASITKNYGKKSVPEGSTQSKRVVPAAAFPVQGKPTLSSRHSHLTLTTPALQRSSSSDATNSSRTFTNLGSPQRHPPPLAHSNGSHRSHELSLPDVEIILLPSSEDESQSTVNSQTTSANAGISNVGSPSVSSQNKLQARRIPFAGHSKLNNEVRETSSPKKRNKESSTLSQNVSKTVSSSLVVDLTEKITLTPLPTSVICEGDDDNNCGIVDSEIMSQDHENMELNKIPCVSLQLQETDNLCPLENTVTSLIDEVTEEGICSIGGMQDELPHLPNTEINENHSILEELAGRKLNGNIEDSFSEDEEFEDASDDLNESNERPETTGPLVKEKRSWCAIL